MGAPGFPGVWLLEGWRRVQQSCPHAHLWRMQLGLPGKTSPPRRVGGGGREIRREQLVPHPWLPPCQEGGRQPFVRLRLPCFPKSVWKPIGCNFQPSLAPV